MISNFRASRKTRHPGCCHWSCCGNGFGRIDRRSGSRVHGINRMKQTRRYAKKVEKQIVKKEIQRAIMEDSLDLPYFGDSEVEWNYHDYDC